MAWKNVPHLTAGLLALFLFLFVGATATAQTVTLYKFDALGGTWLANNVTWTEIEGEWLVTTVVSAARKPDQNLTVPQVLIASCEEILHRTPLAPVTGINRTNIFRVDLNIIAGNNRPAYGGAVPIPVTDGKCVITNEVHSPTYPGKLKGWHLINVSVQTVGVGTQNSADRFNRMQMLFERNEKVKTEPAPFDFNLACEAIRIDPTVRAYQKLIEQQAQAQDIEFRPNNIAVMLKHPVEPGRNYGVMAGNVYDTSSGACVEIR